MEDQGVLSARPDRFVDGFARRRVLSQFGDDVLHVQRTGFSLRLRFFPNASTYILAGLEPVGQVPDLTRVNPETLNSNLAELRNSMSTLLKTHYFVTEEMKTELGRSNLSGTVPVLYVFLARLGCTVLDTTFVHSPADGVRIAFSHGGHSQTLYYFRTDLAGGGSDQSCVLSHGRRRFFRRSQFFTRSQQLYCSGRLRNSFASIQ